MVIVDSSLLIALVGSPLKVATITWDPGVALSARVAVATPEALVTAVTIDVPTRNVINFPLRLVAPWVSFADTLALAPYAPGGGRSEVQRRRGRRPGRRAGERVVGALVVVDADEGSAVGGLDDEAQGRPGRRQPMSRVAVQIAASIVLGVRVRSTDCQHEQGRSHRSCT